MRVKLCCSSRSYARSLEAGALTQLEWIDLCAHQLLLDGVDFDWTHFPRTDEDYLAQIKKLCADRCLTVAAVTAAQFFGAGLDTDEQVSELKRWIDVALALGSPLLCFPCGAPLGSPGIAWRELILGLKYACVHAKRQNVTLALQPAEGSLVASVADVRRAFKECDSAWLRVEPAAGDLSGEQAGPWATLLADTVIIAAGLDRLDTFGADENIDYRSVLASLVQSRYRGFLSLQYAGEELEADAVPRAVTWLRDMVAKAP
ncbi:MAG: TIM barrel protein [Candidatus Eremiobacteraeota bacterium]|nr:TIM barrel protein [Candidatus Eremiobacteraeota bacterium]